MIIHFNTVKGERTLDIVHGERKKDTSRMHIRKIILLRAFKGGGNRKKNKLSEHTHIITCTCARR